MVNITVTSTIIFGIIMPTIIILKDKKIHVEFIIQKEANK